MAWSSLSRQVLPFCPALSPSHSVCLCVCVCVCVCVCGWGNVCVCVYLVLGACLGVSVCIGADECLEALAARLERIHGALVSVLDAVWLDMLVGFEVCVWMFMS